MVLERVIGVGHNDLCSDAVADIGFQVPGN